MNARQLGDGIAVLRLVARGMTNAEISAELFISAGTVKSRLRRLYGLLGARTAAHAVAIAGMQRLLTPEDLRAAATVRRRGWVAPEAGLRQQKEA